MTSGEFHSIPIDKITIPPRVRKDLGNADKAADSLRSLADSIRRLGLIHPIVVTRDTLEVVAGERRLRACISLGHDRISVQYLDEVDDATRREIEAEENLKRKGLNDWEECDAVKQYFDLRRSRDPEYTQEKMAEDIGMSQQWISDHLTVIKGEEEGITGLRDMPTAPLASF